MIFEEPIRGDGPRVGFVEVRFIFIGTGSDLPLSARSAVIRSGSSSGLRASAQNVGQRHTLISTGASPPIFAKPVKWLLESNASSRASGVKCLVFLRWERSGHPKAGHLERGKGDSHEVDCRHLANAVERPAQQLTEQERDSSFSGRIKTLLYHPPTKPPPLKPPPPPKPEPPELRGEEDMVAPVWVDMRLKLETGTGKNFCLQYLFTPFSFSIGGNCISQ